MQAPSESPENRKKQEQFMDMTTMLAKLKKRPGFAENVGMILVHNGVVRGWSRKDHSPIASMYIRHDSERMEAICRELEQRPGIFCIMAEAVDGELKPGDDVLLLAVAGDIREHVKPVLAELLDRIKAEAVVKEERPHSGEKGPHRPCLDESLNRE